MLVGDRIIAGKLRLYGTEPNTEQIREVQRVAYYWEDSSTVDRHNLAMLRLEKSLYLGVDEYVNSIRLPDVLDIPTGVCSISGFDDPDVLYWDLLGDYSDYRDFQLQSDQVEIIDGRGNIVISEV